MKQALARKLGVLAFVPLLAACSSAPAKTKDLDIFFSASARNRQFNGSVLVAENGKVLYEKSFGYADFPNRKPNTGDTVFPLASISKTLTATAILQLYEKGKLRLADPVAAYFPEFPYPEITIRHLLSHTSGLPPYNAFFDAIRETNPDKVFTNADFIPGLIARQKPLLYRPGENGNYDNVNFIILALILEKASGRPYSECIESQILRPSGMKETSLYPSSLLFDPSGVKPRNLAIPHWYPHFYSSEPIRADSMPYVSSYWHAYNFLGFGDYISTTHDLLKFDQALYDGRLLSEAVLKEAFTPVKLKDGNDNALSYGLGWASEKDESLGKIVYHGGGAIGLSCVLSRNITRRQTVILYDIARDNARPMALSAFKILNGRPVRSPGESLAIIYGRVLVGEGPAAAQSVLEKLKKGPVAYELNEDEFNTLGYDLLGDNNPFHRPEERRVREALNVFKLNIELFPASWNAYDSYGEALLKAGEKEEAIRMYRKSIELNPKNENGKKVLERLSKDNPK